jgi:hypothetical protein
VTRRAGRPQRKIQQQQQPKPQTLPYDIPSCETHGLRTFPHFKRPFHCDHPVASSWYSFSPHHSPSTAHITSQQWRSSRSLERLSPPNHSPIKYFPFHHNHATTISMISHHHHHHQNHQSGNISIQYNLHLHITSHHIIYAAHHTFPPPHGGDEGFQRA